MNSRFRLLLRAVLLTLPVCPFALAQVNYSVSILPTLGGPRYPGAFTINNAGQIAGSSQPSPVTSNHAMLVQDGIATDLGTLYPAGGSFARGLNSFGEVVGSAHNQAASERPILFSGGMVTDLGFGSTGANGAQGWSINDSGDFVGILNFADFTSRGFLYSGGSFTVLPTLGGNFGQARVINNSGQIAGHASNASNRTYAVLYTDGIATNLGALNASDYGSRAYDLNNDGMVVGYVTLASFASEAYYYADGAMTGLGTLGGADSLAWGVNDLGDIVGYSDTAADEQHAFLFTKRGDG